MKLRRERGQGHRAVVRDEDDRAQLFDTCFGAFCSRSRLASTEARRRISRGCLAHSSSKASRVAGPPRWHGRRPRRRTRLRRPHRHLADELSGADLAEALTTPSSPRISRSGGRAGRRMRIAGITLRDRTDPPEHPGASRRAPPRRPPPVRVPRRARPASAHRARFRRSWCVPSPRGRPWRRARPDSRRLGANGAPRAEHDVMVQPLGKDCPSSSSTGHGSQMSLRSASDAKSERSKGMRCCSRSRSVRPRRTDRHPDGNPARPASARDVRQRRGQMAAREEPRQIVPELS